MQTFSWATKAPSRTLHRLSPDGVVYVISDLHLGDGSSTDIFMAKDRHLLAFLDKVDKEGATLVVAGDAVDFSQAWALTRILRAHGKVLGAFSRLASQGRMVYVIGNHDHDLHLYQELLNIPVVTGVEVGPDTCILHGYEYDPIIGADLGHSEFKTKVHHLVERALGSWIRLPLQHFYSIPNRISFWLFHKMVILLRARGRFLRWATGDSGFLTRFNAEVAYWTRGQLGDPASIFRPAMAFLKAGPYRTLICGHSHLPGVVRTDNQRTYANTGSWTFNSSTYLRIEGEGLLVKDWLSGKVYDDRLYRPLLAGELDGVDFLDWWEQHYRGWLRFRLGRIEKEGPSPLGGSPPPQGNASSQ